MDLQVWSNVPLYWQKFQMEFCFHPGVIEYYVDGVSFGQSPSSPNRNIGQWLQVNMGWWDSVVQLSKSSLFVARQMRGLKFVQVQGELHDRICGNRGVSRCGSDWGRSARQSGCKCWLAKEPMLKTVGLVMINRAFKKIKKNYFFLLVWIFDSAFSARSNHWD